MIHTDKKQILEIFKQQVEDKILDLKNQIKDLTEDAQNDAKGSAGDKHETGLAMMHLEQEKLNNKLKLAIDQLHILNIIDPDKTMKKVALGALLELPLGYFFVCDALQPIMFNNIKIVPLSINAPIYQALKAKIKEEVIEFNGKKNLIKNIL